MTGSIYWSVGTYGNSQREEFETDLYGWVYAAREGAPNSTLFMTTVYNLNDDQLIDSNKNGERLPNLKPNCNY